MTTTSQPYRYLISYADTLPGGISHGNAELKLPTPIRTMDDVQTVTKLIREHFGLTSPVLLGFSRFEDAPPLRQAS
ncbi:hypothetical protein OHA21_47060 [Actinoplanes sp. NBC_00393]|uniref:hypothetical protein n=1 Tax=Actinoplanes sp. NBC_00393 TaxID=2975953 RepID=UPI002E20003B